MQFLDLKRGEIGLVQTLLRQAGNAEDEIWARISSEADEMVDLSVLPLDQAVREVWCLCLCLPKCGWTHIPVTLPRLSAAYIQSSWDKLRSVDKVSKAPVEEGYEPPCVVAYTNDAS